MRRIRGYVKRLLPMPLLRWYAIRQARRQLRGVEPLYCDASALAPADPFRPNEVFEDPRYHGSWQRVARAIAALAITDRAGGVNPGDRRAIYYLVRHFAPRSVLEIGTHIGASTVHIAAALRDLGHESAFQAGRLTTVDFLDVNDPRSALWKRHGSAFAPGEMVRALDCDGLVRFVTSRSADFLAACREKFDLIFLDGSHAAADVYREICGALRLLRTGGRVLLHDYFPELKPLPASAWVVPGPRLAAERLQREGAPIAVTALGTLPWSTKGGSRVTTLALLGRSPAEEAAPPEVPVIHPMIRRPSREPDSRCTRRA